MEASKAHCPSPVQFQVWLRCHSSLLLPPFRVPPPQSCKCKPTSLIRARSQVSSAMELSQLTPSGGMSILPLNSFPCLGQELYASPKRCTFRPCWRGTTGPKQRGPSARDSGFRLLFNQSNDHVPSGHLLRHPKTSRAGLTEEANLDPSESDVKRARAGQGAGGLAPSPTILCRGLGLPGCPDCPSNKCDTKASVCRLLSPRTRQKAGVQASRLQQSRCPSPGNESMTVPLQPRAAKQTLHGCGRRGGIVCVLRL